MKQVNIYFWQYETIKSFDENIYASKISIKEDEMDETNLLENIVKFNNKFRPKTKEGVYEKFNW